MRINILGLATYLLVAVDKTLYMTGSPEELPNVLLIVLDSVRATNTNLGGYERNTTPFLKELAECSTVYGQARAPSIWSLPSHVSMFTGVPPHQHGVHTRNQALEPGHSIWENLAEELGYSTGLFTSNVYLTEIPVGLDTTFQTVVGRDELVPYPKALTPKKADASNFTDYWKASLNHDEFLHSIINGIADKGRSELSRLSLFNNILARDECATHSKNFQEWVNQKSGPWAACINFMDAHSPYLPKDEFNNWGGSDLRDIHDSISSVWDFVKDEQPWWKCEALSNLYDGAILQMDNEIENIVNHLKNINEFGDTHIVIAGDHGEGFGEYSNIRSDVRYTAHGYGIHDSLLHVPLLSKEPHQRKGTRVTQLASLTSFYDVVSTTVGLSSGKESFRVDEAHVSSVERSQQFESYPGIGSEYRGDSFAIYRNNGDKIQKFSKWGSDEVEITFAQLPKSPILSIDAGGHDAVDQMLEDKGNNLLCQTSGDNPIGQDVKQRLEDLGYA